MGGKDKALVKAAKKSAESSPMTEERAKKALDEYRESKDILTKLLLPKLISIGIYKIAVVNENYGFVDIVLGSGSVCDGDSGKFESSFVKTEEVFYACQEMMDFFELNHKRIGHKKTPYEYFIDAILEEEKKEPPFLMVSYHKKVTDYLTKQCDVVSEREQRYILKSKEHGTKFLFCEADKSLETVAGGNDFTYIQVSDKGVLGFKFNKKK